MTARYIDSVPMLRKQWRLRGYIWQAGPFADASQADLIVGYLASQPRDADVAYVGRLPDSRILLASKSNDPPVLPMSTAIFIQPWKVQLYNDVENSVPLAVLDGAGRYFQLESFGQLLDAPFPDLPEQPDTPHQPVICEFLIALTAGGLRICPD